MKKLFERLLQLVKMDRSSRDPCAAHAFVHSCQTRRRYQCVTAADVQRLLAARDWNDNLDSAVMDCIDFRIGDAYDHDLEIVSGLPPPLQMVFSTWRLDAEVRNGGFHQYFYNQGRFAFMAAEGCRLISADAHLNLLLQAIDVYLNEEPTQGLFRPSEVKEMLGLYVLARKFSDLPSLDREYYALPALDDFRTEYMQRHPDEFVIPRSTCR